MTACTYALPVDELFDLSLAVKAVQRELERWMNEAMRPLGLTAAQADALVMIGHAGQLSLKDLGALLIAESGHPSRLVDRLVSAGLVDRSVSPTDRRQVVLSLTLEGKAVERRVRSAREDALRVGRELLAGRDVRPALELAELLLAGSPSGELLERRRRLGM